MKRKTVLLGVVSAFTLLMTLALAPAAMAVSCDAAGPFADDCLPPKPQQPDCDGRINCKHGDDAVILYNGVDDSGNPTLELWCEWEGQTFASLVIPQSTFAGFPAMPEQNTLVKSTTLCGEVVEVWILTTGEYQVMIHHADGSVAVVIFTGLPAEDIHFYDIP